jgi:hypothetical protein
VLVWFAVPLSAASIRPLRRPIERTALGIWDRGADFVLCCMFGGWIAGELTGILSALRGYDVPIASQTGTISLIAMAFIAARMLFEQLAVEHYPYRLAVVGVKGELDNGTFQTAISLVGQIALFVFIAKSYMTWNRELLFGTIVFYSVLVPWLFVDRLPKWDWVDKVTPRGLAKWVWIIVAGVPAGMLLEHFVTDPAKAVSYGFIFLPIPVLLVWGADLFIPEDDDEAGESEEEDEEVPAATAWSKRLLGVPGLLLCMYLVLWA